MRRAKSSLREVCLDGTCIRRGARPGGGHLSCQPRPQSLASGAGLQTGSGTRAGASAAARERLTPRSAVHIWCVVGWRRFPASRAPVLQSRLWLCAPLSGAPHPFCTVVLAPPGVFRPFLLCGMHAVALLRSRCAASAKTLKDRRDARANVAAVCLLFRPLWART